MSSVFVGAPSSRLLLALVALPLVGCFSGMQPSLMTLQSVKKPVMLTPVDRIGGGAPLPSQKTGEFEGESVALFTHSESYEGATVDRTKIDNVQVVVDAQKALAQAGPDSEIKVTTLRAWARGWPAGVKNTVHIEGDVVTMGGAK
jgi:hypothetical protein